MTPQLSRTQIARLGDELRLNVLTKASPMWATYEIYLNRCEVLREKLQARVEACLVGLEVAVSGRTKSRDTLRDKLISKSTIKLGNIDDVIGVRIVGDFTLSEQDKICKLLEVEFAPVHKIIDRRSNPVSGYRALHLIIKTEEMHAEIQIRTSLQSQWADLFERTADIWGRQIRYGMPPNFGSEEMRVQREDVIESMINLSLEYISNFEEHFDNLQNGQPRSEEDLLKDVPTAKQIRGRSQEDLRRAFRIKLGTQRVITLKERKEKADIEYSDLIAGLRKSIGEILDELVKTLD